MGLNPHFQHRRRNPALDIALVAGAVLVCAVLVAWAFLG